MITPNPFHLRALAGLPSLNRRRRHKRPLRVILAALALIHLAAAILATIYR